MPQIVKSSVVVESTVKPYNEKTIEKLIKDKEEYLKRKIEDNKKMKKVDMEEELDEQLDVNTETDEEMEETDKETDRETVQQEKQPRNRKSRK